MKLNPRMQHVLQAKQENVTSLSFNFIIELIAPRMSNVKCKFRVDATLATIRVDRP